MIHHLSAVFTLPGGGLFSSPKPPPPPPAPPPPPKAPDRTVVRSEEAERARRRAGTAQTINTSSQGVLDTARTTQNTLLGN